MFIMLSWTTIAMSFRRKNSFTAKLCNHANKKGIAWLFAVTSWIAFWGLKMLIFEFAEISDKKNNSVYKKSNSQNVKSDRSEIFFWLPQLCIKFELNLHAEVLKNCICSGVGIFLEFFKFLVQSSTCLFDLATCHCFLGLPRISPQIRLTTNF